MTKHALLWIGIISIFPNMFDTIKHYGIISKAINKKLIDIHIWNPRNYTTNKYKTVDNRPYGGGPGMIMSPEPFLKAINSAKKFAKTNVKIIYLSPQGKKWNQKLAYKYSKLSKFILICGRYEGIDERIINIEVDEEWSIGDYILTGGELAAMVIIDSISRLIPGVLNKQSLISDSFSHGLLNYPQYTRPEIVQGNKVPSILISGHHSNIKKWRLKESLGRTWIRRPDLLKKISLNKIEKRLLNEFKKDYQK